MSDSMTIEEVQEKRATLEQTIRSLVADFESETNVTVGRILPQRESVRCLGASQPAQVLTSVRVELQL